MRECIPPHFHSLPFPTLRDDDHSGSWCSIVPRPMPRGSWKQEAPLSSFAGRTAFNHTTVIPGIIITPRRAVVQLAPGSPPQGMTHNLPRPCGAETRYSSCRPRADARCAPTCSIVGRKHSQKWGVALHAAGHGHWWRCLSGPWAMGRVPIVPQPGALAPPPANREGRVAARGWKVGQGVFQAPREVGASKRPRSYTTPH